jgi:hypothetical protein
VRSGKRRFSRRLRPKTGGVDLSAVGRYSDYSEESKTLLAQLMDFLPWSTFARIVARYGGDARVRTLCCAKQYRAMAFAQLTYRESLRDIEVCLSAQAPKLYHMGFRVRVRRSTLADANETRDWRIYAEFVHRLIAQARKLYAEESLGIELSNTVYALESTTTICVYRCFHGRTFAPPRPR